MIAMIGAGTLVAVSTEGEKEVFYISGGFAHVRENEVTILAEECIRQADIDPEQAWEQLQEARMMPTTNDEELAAREQAVLAANAKFTLAQKLRKQSQKKS